MPLTQEQFNDLRDKGLSVDQIIAFESGQKPPDLEIPPMVSAHSIKATPRSSVSKTIDLASRGLGELGNIATRKVYSPFAEAMFKNQPEKVAALSKISSGPLLPKDASEVAYPSDVLNTVFPMLKETKNIPISTPAGAAVGFGTDMAANIVGDPLSYLTFGEKTALGKAMESVSEARQAGQSIKLDSKLAQTIADHYGETKASPRLINKFIKDYGEPADAFSQQVSKGQASLASLSVPFSEKSIPLATGKIAGALVKPLSIVRRGALGVRVEQAVRDLFTTTSGNPKFDRLQSNYRDILYSRVNNEVESGKQLDQQIDDLSKELSIPREDLEKQITSHVEELKRIKNGKLYPKDIMDGMAAHYQDKLVDAQVGLANAHTGYLKAKGAGDDKLALAFQKAIDLHAQNVVDYQGQINKITGKFATPPPINPKVDAIVRNMRARNAQQLFDQETAGVSKVKLLADREYMTHAQTTEAADARIAKLKAEGKWDQIKSKNPREMNEFLANNIRRQFSEINPRVIDAWEEAGFITPREANDIRAKKPLSRTAYDTAGEKRQIKVKIGLDKLDQLLTRGKINEAQFNDAVHTLSVREVNDLSAAGKLKNTYGDYRGPIFHTDPVMSSTIRGVRGAKSITSAEFFNELKSRKIAIPEASAPEGWIKPSQSIKELQGHKVAPEVARVLNNFQDFYHNPETVSKILRNYDKFHSLMKAWTLGVFPAYHTKNMVGNFFNNFLAGVTNPDVYRQAVATRLGKYSWARKVFGDVKFKDVFGTEWNTAKLVAEAKKRGVIGKGWFGGDIAKSMEQKLEGGKWLTGSSRNQLLRGGQAVGKEIEDNARMAHFIDRLRKGDTAEQAAMSVKKFLFDYGDLSKTERNVLNRLFFFYTWTRKNIPLQLHSLVTNPAKFALAFKAKHVIEGNAPDAPEKYLPEYVKENLPIRMRYNSKTKQYEYFMLNNWLPAADLLKLSHVHEIAAQMLSPLPKELLQQYLPSKSGGGIDFFTKEPIQKYKGEMGSLHVGSLDMKAPIRAVHAAKNIRLLNEIDKLSSPDADAFSKFVNFMTGKNYNFDVTKARLQNKSRLDDEISVLKSAMMKESLKKPIDKKEVKRITKMIQDKYKEY